MLGNAINLNNYLDYKMYFLIIILFIKQIVIVMNSNAQSQMDSAGLQAQKIKQHQRRPD